MFANKKHVDRVLRLYANSSAECNYIVQWWSEFRSGQPSKPASMVESIGGACKHNGLIGDKNCSSRAI